MLLFLQRDGEAKVPSRLQCTPRQCASRGWPKWPTQWGSNTRLWRWTWPITIFWEISETVPLSDPSHPPLHCKVQFLVAGLQQVVDHFQGSKWNQVYSLCDIRTFTATILAQTVCKKSKLYLEYLHYTHVQIAERRKPQSSVMLTISHTCTVASGSGTRIISIMKSNSKNGEFELHYQI